MTRTVRSAATAAMLMGGLMAIGCASADRPGLQERFQNLNNNNCWPERPSAMAREAVLHPFETQQNNARALDGVLNNLDFEAGTEKLNGVGRDKLDRLARKMPAPNPTVYLQTANDVAYDDKAPDRTAAARMELDQKRGQAVLTYLASRPNRGVNYEVQPIDIADPGVNSSGPSQSVRGIATQYRSTLQGAVGGQLQGTGGGLATGTLGVTPGANVAAPQPNTGGTPTGSGGILLR
jgi:hypothetical protein